MAKTTTSSITSNNTSIKQQPSSSTIIHTPRATAIKIHEQHIEEYGYVDERLMSSVRIILEHFGDEDHDLRKLIIGAIPFFYQPVEIYSWCKEDEARFVAGNIRALAFGKQIDAAWLWLYNEHSPFLIEQPTQNGILFITLDMIEKAEKDNDVEFFEELEYLSEIFPTIYDERNGNGYAYHFTDNGNMLLHPVFDETVPEMFPQELFLLVATGEISFITDQLASCYDMNTFDGPSHKPSKSQQLREQRYGRPGKHETMKPGCAYKRVFFGGLFEFACTMPCLSDELRDKLMKMWTNMQGRSHSAFHLSHLFGSFRSKYRDADTAEIEETLLDAVIAWEHGNLGWEATRALYVLMDTEPTDEELFSFIGAIQQRSGNVDLVRHARQSGQRIWDLLR